MPAWIAFTLLAAFVQNLRFMLQKHLRGTGLSTAGATFSRFVWAVPMATVALIWLVGATGADLPQMSARFWSFATIGGVAQISATMCVVALFTSRNFTVGVSLKKTETLLTAIVGLVVLGEGVSSFAMGAILIGVLGVILLSDPPQADATTPLAARVFNRASGLGLASGALFAVSATCYRGALQALGDDPVLVRTLFTLICVTGFQTVIMSAYLRWFEPGELARVFRHWRVTFLVGLFGIVGSFGWFAAFALQNAAYVKAVGQIELVFTFLGSWLVFRETSTWREILGVVLIVVSILLIVL